MDEMRATTEIGERSISDEVAAIEARLEGYQPPARSSSASIAP